MPKSMAREHRPERVDTEDRLMERFFRVTVWAEHHRRAVLLGAVALAAVVAGVFYYVDYRGKLLERAAVRIQEIRFSAARAQPAELQSNLIRFLEQYGNTPHGDEARVLLAEIELSRDSTDAAIRTAEPVAADLASGSPTAYIAATLLATAYEQRGDAAEAMRWYAHIASTARFAYQRQGAMAEHARLHVAAGRYAEAVALYEQLLGETGEDLAGTVRTATRLGEVRGLLASNAPPPVTPTAEPPPPDTGSADAIEGSDETAEAGSDSASP